MLHNLGLQRRKLPPLRQPEAEPEVAVAAELGVTGSAGFALVHNSGEDHLELEILLQDNSDLEPPLDKLVLEQDQSLQDRLGFGLVLIQDIHKTEAG